MSSSPQQHTRRTILAAGAAAVAGAGIWGLVKPSRSKSYKANFTELTDYQAIYDSSLEDVLARAKKGDLDSSLDLIDVLLRIGQDSTEFSSKVFPLEAKHGNVVKMGVRRLAHRISHVLEGYAEKVGRDLSSREIAEIFSTVFFSSEENFRFLEDDSRFAKIGRTCVAAHEFWTLGEGVCEDLVGAMMCVNHMLKKAGVDLNMHVVSMPGHTLLGVYGGDEPVFIETTRKGMIVPRDAYASRFGGGEIPECYLTPVPNGAIQNELFNTGQYIYPRNLSRAQQYFEFALGLEKPSPDIHIVFGEALTENLHRVSADDFKAAVDEADKTISAGIKLDPDCRAAALTRAKLFQTAARLSDKPLEAIHYFDKAANLTKGARRLPYRLSLSNRIEGRTNFAVILDEFDLFLERFAVSNDPADIQKALETAHSLDYLSKKSEETKAKVESMKMRLLGSGFLAQHQTYPRKKLLDAAIDCFSRAVDQYPSTFCYYSRGIAHYLKGDFQDAVDNFTMAVGQARRSGNARLLRGAALSALGEKEWARRELGRAVSLLDWTAYRSADEVLAGVNSNQYPTASTQFLERRKTKTLLGYVDKQNAAAVLFDEVLKA